ncbi:MAG: alpha/beta hydrolase [Muribaculaceae bacterium]|nr:alpha/beta hydrolase [Muribaculaceae bacterium]
MKKLFLYTVAVISAFIVSTCILQAQSSRFYESWEGWNKKYKGTKEMPDDWDWGPDILPGYESKFINQGEAFDGPVRSTVIRLLSKKPTKKAFLYVHGFNDYFFQDEWGKEFVDSGYNFYAVDLRRYGRSRLPWQYPYNVRDQKEYFADIDSALNIIRRDGNTDITLGGHSTGGLTVAYYAAYRGARIGVNRVVTDSPFLAWNFNPFTRKVAAPMIGAFGKIIPNAEVKQGHCDGYAYSLLKQYDGEWEYNTDWKMIYSPPVKWSWIGAIDGAQKDLMRRKEHITVPILIMTSSRKIEGCNYTPEFLTGDAVLDPTMIRRRGEQLADSSRRTVCVIDSGIHDLILSPLPAREEARSEIFKFIRQH